MFWRHIIFTRINSSKINIFNILTDILVHLFFRIWITSNNSSSVLSWCIEKLIVDNLLPYSCNVQGSVPRKYISPGFLVIVYLNSWFLGQFYLDSTKTLSILTYMVRSYEIYRYICSKRNVRFLKTNKKLTYWQKKNFKSFFF